MTADPAMYRNQHRGHTQPQRQDRHETDEEKRRRLHREAAEAVKRHAAALREAKARYHEYDMAMAESDTGDATAPEEPKAISGPKEA